MNSYQHLSSIYMRRKRARRPLKNTYGTCGVSGVSGRQHISKAAVIAYKECLAAHYAPASVNSMLIAVNRFLRFCGWETCCVQLLKIQRQIFVREDKELTKAEYQQLVKAANGTQLSYVLQAICGTGIRVSELQYITVEAVRAGKAVVNCKNKLRIILIPASLQKLLTKYIKKSGIKAGSIFVHKKRKAFGSKQYLESHESAMRTSWVPTQKSIPTPCGICLRASFILSTEILSALQTCSAIAASTRHVSIQWKPGISILVNWNDCRKY